MAKLLECVLVGLIAFVFIWMLSQNGKESFGDGEDCNKCEDVSDKQYEQAVEVLPTESTIGYQWMHPVADGFEGGKSDNFQANDLLPKEGGTGWEQQYLNCKNLVSNKNFLDAQRFKFSNEVLDTRNTKYQSLDIRKTPIVPHNPVSIWQKSPIDKSIWEYIRPSLDD